MLQQIEIVTDADQYGPFVVRAYRANSDLIGVGEGHMKRCRRLCYLCASLEGRLIYRWARKMWPGADVNVCVSCMAPEAGEGEGYFVSEEGEVLLRSEKASLEAGATSGGDVVVRTSTGEKAADIEERIKARMRMMRPDVVYLLPSIVDYASYLERVVGGQDVRPLPREELKPLVPVENECAVCGFPLGHRCPRCLTDSLCEWELVEMSDSDRGARMKEEHDACAAIESIMTFLW